MFMHSLDTLAIFIFTRVVLNPCLLITLSMEFRAISTEFSSGLGHIFLHLFGKFGNFILDRYCDYYTGECLDCFL